MDQSIKPLPEWPWSWHQATYGTKEQPALADQIDIFGITCIIHRFVSLRGSVRLDKLSLRMISLAIALTFSPVAALVGKSGQDSKADIVGKRMWYLQTQPAIKEWNRNRSHAGHPWTGGRILDPLLTILQMFLKVNFLVALKFSGDFNAGWLCSYKLLQLNQSQRFVDTLKPFRESLAGENLHLQPDLERD